MQLDISKLANLITKPINIKMRMSLTLETTKIPADFQK